MDAGGKKLPTPEELGEMIERGEITHAEANELMAERIRRQAFVSMFDGLGGVWDNEGTEPPGR
jgi:hypothetical protein